MNDIFLNGCDKVSSLNSVVEKIMTYKFRRIVKTKGESYGNWIDA